MLITEEGLFLVKDTDFDNSHLENLIKTPEPEEYTDSKINSVLSNVLEQFRNIYSKLVDLHGSFLYIHIRVLYNFLLV